MTDITTYAAAPTWLAFAAQTLKVTQHRRIPRHLLEACDTGLDGVDFGPPNLPPLIDLTEEWAAQNGTTEAAFTVKRPDRIGTTLDLLSTLRLCATFGDRQTADALCNAAAMTALDVGHPDWIGPVSKAMADVLPDHTVFRSPDKLHGGDLLILAPSPGETLASTKDASRFALKISEALEHETPLLLITAGHRNLPEKILRILPPSTRLAPLDTEMTLAMLHLRFEDGDTRWHTPLRRALPASGMLGRLGVDALHAAFREADGASVVRTLADQAAAMVPTDGPTLDDLADGGGEAVAAARRIMADLALWKEGKVLWGDCLHSLLLVGAPGTGKTYLARSMARGSDYPLIQASFAQWQSQGHLGDMLRAMRDTFAEAIAAAPCVLFIDEIDAAGSRQSDDRHAVSYRRQVINSFLEQVDIAMRAEGIVLVGACNDLEALDPAIRRPGRFDGIANVPLPGRKALSIMLTRQIGDEVEPHQIDEVVMAALGATPARIDAAIRAARSHARGKGRPLRLDDVIIQLQGAKPPDRSLMWRVAIHECGHAILAAEHDLGTLARITLRDGDGTTALVPNLGAGLPWDHRRMLSYVLGGRAAELVIFGTPGGGSGGPDQACDLAMATRIAIALETSYGSGIDGLMWSPVDTVRRISDPTLRRAVRRTLNTAEAKARHVLEHHRVLLLEMAKDLLRSRILEGPALQLWIDRISGDAPWDPEDPYGRRPTMTKAPSECAAIIDLAAHRNAMPCDSREPP